MALEQQLEISWHDHGRAPQCAPNPAYPNGVDVDLSRGEQGCSSPLPYPAKRCGIFLVRCERCASSAAITTAGRPDDPRSIKLRCKR